MPLPRIDRADLAVGLLVGLLTIAIKLLHRANTEWQFNGLDALVAFLVTITYVVYRGRRQPEKLDEWGLTTPLTLRATLVGIALLLVGVASLAAAAWAVQGRVYLEPALVPRMIHYIPAAFPQQFFMCSVGLVTLAKFPVLSGLWRLPLVVGLIFGLAHFWTPAHLPGSAIPLQVIGTFPAGFACAWYFLRFRSILPLTLAHAILYVFLSRWVESAL
jgi:membrane protease YdiL (CAAX protease family)